MLTKAAPNTSNALMRTFQPSGLAADIAKAVREKLVKR